jgi:hypothetical protein
MSAPGITLRVIYQDCQHSSILPNIGKFRESWQRILASANIHNRKPQRCLNCLVFIDRIIYKPFLMPSLLSEHQGTIKTKESGLSLADKRPGPVPGGYYLCAKVDL